MSQNPERIKQLEEENKVLKEQLLRMDTDQSRYNHLKDILKHNKEVVAVIAFDKQGTVEEISDSISVYGYTPDEFISGQLSYWDIVHPDDLDNLQKAIEKRTSHNSNSFGIDYRIYNKEGQIVWVMGTSVPINSSSGSIEKYVVKMNNINRRKKYEEELQDTNENLFVTLKSIGESVILMDADGYVERLNAAAEKMLGIINLKAKNKPLKEVVRFSFSPDFSTFIDPLNIEIDSHRMVQLDEVFMRSPFDVQYRVSCNVSPIYIQKTKLMGYVMVVKDLTSVYNSLQAAQESEMALRAKLELLLSDDVAAGDVELTDIIAIEQLQLLQDNFSITNGVSSVITDLKGIPITRPSNFNDVCDSIFHAGADCYQVDRLIHGVTPTGRSCKLIDDKAPIYIGDRHVAYWKIGMCGFGGIVAPFVKSACASVDAYTAAYISLQDDIRKHFENICNLLKVMAGEISNIGYSNLKLAHELMRGKENEAKLAESETTIRSIFDNSADGILLINQNGIITEWSHGYEQLSGISKKQAIGKNIWEAVHTMLPKNRYSEEQLAQMHSELDLIIHRMEYSTITRQIVNQKTKQEHTIRTLYFPVRMPGAMMVGAISRDITEDIRNERQLTENNALLEGIMNTLPAGLFVKDLNGHYIKFNDAFLETFNLTKEQVLGKKISQVFPQESHTIEKLEQKLLAGGKTLRVATNVELSSDGRDRMSYRNVFYDENDKAQGIVGVIFDTTDLKNAERGLIAEKERLQSLGDNLPNGCLYRFTLNTQNGEMGFTYMSRSWEEITGIPVDTALKDLNSLLSRIHPDDLPVYLQAFEESVASMSHFNVEVRFILNKGVIRWGHISSTPRMDGHIIIWDGFILDISERKDAELKLEEYRTDLENLVKERTEELEASNEELYATNEELYATNEEFAVTNEELHQKNNQLQHEVVARKELMSQLEDSENKMRNFITQSYEGIVIINEEGKIIEWNAAQERITGIKHEEAIGNYAWEIYHLLVPQKNNNESDHFRESVLSFLKSGIDQDPDESEHMFITAEGNERYINMTSFPIGLAGKCYLGEIVRDITEQKMADLELERYQTQLEKMVESQTKELIQSKERLTSLSDNLPGGVIYQMLDNKKGQTRFTYVSAQFADMFKIGIDEVMADSNLFYQAIHPDDKEMLKEHYAIADQRGYIDLECRMIVGEGDTIWIHMRSSNHMQEDGTRVWDGFMVDVTSRKLAEQELEESRKRQNILIKILQIVQSLESIPDAINIALSEIGRYADVSRAYIFEKSADGRTASNTYEWCNEGIAPEIDNLQNMPIEVLQDWFDAFKAGKHVYASDIRTLGEEIYQHLSIQGIKSILVLPLVANGVNYGFVGFDECTRHKEWQPKEVDLLISLSQIISAATRRYWAEKTMQLSQQTMRTVLDNIDANIYVADFDTYEILFANKKIKEQMGGEIEGKRCWQTIQKDQIGPCDFCPNPKLLDSKKQPTGLYHWEAWNTNMERWYECTDAAIEWVDGRLVHMEYATDITDRKRAEEALRQSEELYRQLTVASPDAIVVCNPLGHIVYMSPKAKELFFIGDYTSVESLRLYRFVHPHDLGRAFGMFHLFVQDNVAFLPQLLLRRSDGSEFFGEISSASVKDSNGQTSSVIMVIRDISERKMSEMELIRAKEKAEESDNLKSAFLANMSHEIRTPINGIVGFLNFLADDNLTSKRRQEYITVVNNSSIQLVKLIDDIIDVAKIEARQMNIRPVPFHINEFMSELQVFFETYLQANHKDKIALILDDSQFIDSCFTYIDPMRLRQVLTNLIGNAIKFTEKGFIRFGYRLLPPDKLEFVVEDSGIGLAADQLEVIFERFRQAELTNSRRYGGTGLGLTISRSLVQMMGGDIRVESSEGEGSTFYFTVSYLPISPGDEVIFEENKTGNEIIVDKPFKDRAILIVEPQIMKSKYYEKLLSTTGVTLMFAQTAKQWIDTITQRKRIDVVLADATIFAGETAETAKQVKSVRSGLPLVLIVPEHNEYYDVLICDSQCNRVIEEPVNRNNLYTALKKYM